MPGSPGTTQPLGAVGNCVDCIRSDGFDFALGVVPRHACFPAQTEVDRQVRLDLERILYVGAAVATAAVQKLLAALIVLRWRAQQEIGKVVAGFAIRTQVEIEVSVRRAGIALVDLQVAEFAAELERVAADDFGQAFRRVPCVVGLKCGERVWAHRKVRKVEGRNGLREDRGTRGYDAERSRARNESEVG